MVKVNLIPIVGSSTLSDVGYNAEESKMVVVFKTGATYEYENITKKEFESLFLVESAGKQIKVITSGKPYHKI